MAYTLAYAGVYKDDSQIDELIIRRNSVVKYGKVVVLIEDIDEFFV